MRCTSVFSEGRYTVLSYGNGWAYTVRDDETGRSFWLQDDDATRFREELDSATGRRTGEDICADYMAAIGQAADA